MKLRKVTDATETGYPTYLNYLKNHRKELGIIAAGVGLMLTPGCDENKTTRTGGTPRPPINSPAGKDVTIDGDMAAPIAPQPQTSELASPQPTLGKIKAPAPQKISPPGKPAPPAPQKLTGRAPAPQPVETKGKMAAPVPPENIKSEMPEPKPAEEKK